MNNLNLDYKLNTLYEKLENNNNHKDLKLLWKNYINIKVQKLLTEVDNCNSVLTKLNNNNYNEIDFVNLYILQNIVYK